MQQAPPIKGGVNESHLLARIDKMLDERPSERASILRRLREQSPQLYSAWLMRTAAVPTDSVT